MTPQPSWLFMSILLATSALVLPEAGAAPFPDAVVPQSLAIQLKPNNSASNDLAEVKALGFRCVRRGFHWEAAEKEKGVYDFSVFDRFLDDADRAGVRVLGCIAFGNRLYGPVTAAAGREGYAAYAAALAGRYKGRNIIWEIWNEPNTQTFWGKHGKHNSEGYATEYTALVKAAVPAMRKADPSCMVVAGSVSCLWPPSYAWQEFCFRQGILQTGIAGWSIHPYGFKSPEEPIAAYQKVRDLMVKCGAPMDFPLLNTERGFPVKKAEGWAGGPESAPLQLQYQAWHFVRQYMVDLLCGMKLSDWYEWGGDEFGFGGQGQRRPIFDACRVMVSQLDGYRLVRRLPTDSASDFVLEFRNPSGACKWVVWTAPPSGQGPDQAKAHEVALPVAGTVPITVCDLFGKAGPASVVDGKLRLTLSGSPQYVTLTPRPRHDATMGIPPVRSKTDVALYRVRYR